MSAFNPSDCYYLLCRGVRTSPSRAEGNRARTCPRYIKISLSLSIVGRWDDSSMANMCVLSTVGNVPRGGLTQSVERDTASGGRPGGPPAQMVCAARTRCGQHLFANEVSLLCEGVFDFACILCSVRWFYSPLSSLVPIPPPGTEGALSEYMLSRGWVCWESLLADLIPEN